MRLMLLSLVVFIVPLQLAAEELQFDAWARATAPGATTGAIYGTLTNHSVAARTLSSVLFSQAGHVMIHETREVEGMMRMVHADVALDPGASVQLAPGGLHVMLMRLQTPLVEGCRYPLTLVWDNGEQTSHQFVTGGFGQSVMPDIEGKLCP